MLVDFDWFLQKKYSIFKTFSRKVLKEQNHFENLLESEIEYTDR